MIPQHMMYRCAYIHVRQEKMNTPIYLRLTNMCLNVLMSQDHLEPETVAIIAYVFRHIKTAMFCGAQIRCLTQLYV